VSQYWVPTVDQPDMAEWLDGQVKDIVAAYVGEGFISLNVFGLADGDGSFVSPIRVTFNAADPLDKIETSKDLLELLVEEIESISDSDGLDAEYRPFAESMRTALATALKLLDERLALPTQEAE
jgi:hypothetical protein